VDELDTAILAKLQENARISNRQLAAELDTAPSTCLLRVKALTSRGVIVGHHAELSLAAIGRPVQAMVSIKIHPQALSRASDFGEAVARMPPTLAVFMLSGASDFIVHVAVQDTDRLRDFVLQLAKGPEIADIRSSIVFDARRKTVIESLATR
jgi:DNA-binding Lrp family transcriptional regulator